MSGLGRILIEELQKNGLKAGITSIGHIGEIKEEIDNLKEQSLLDGQFCRESLHWMNFDPSHTMPHAKSILVVAYPQLMTMLKFEYHGKNHAVIIPPTYIYSDVYENVKKIIHQVLTPHQYGIERTKLPAKLLAVRTGLGMYGRNNICYIDGMGSYHRLFTFFTDMPCDEDHWRETAVMPECSKCSACAGACPTGAIERQRFLIHAEKCITYLNEREADFPEWLDKSWHNAVVGCMKCQAVCPKNREFADRAENEALFKEEETETILRKVPLEQLPHPLKQKLDRLDMTEYYNILQRNLSVLIG